MYICIYYNIYNILEEALEGVLISVFVKRHFKHNRTEKKHSSTPELISVRST